MANRPPVVDIGFLQSVVATYVCGVCGLAYSWDVVFDFAPPRHLPHPDCPGRAPTADGA